MSKRALFALFLFGSFVLSPNLSVAEGIDVVVMVDASESMFPFFDDLLQYLLENVLETRLHKGDTFHLLSFASFPEVEISTSINDSSDIEKIINRILLLNPLGQYTDLVTAVEYLYSFTRSLLDKNKKLVLLLTDGIHDPPPAGPYRMDQQRLLEELLQSARKIKKQGWDVHIIQMPGAEVTGEPTKGTGSVVSEESALLNDFVREPGVEIFSYDQDDKKSIVDKAIGLPSKSRIYLYILYFFVAVLLLYLLIRLLLLIGRRIHHLSISGILGAISGLYKEKSAHRPLLIWVNFQNSHIGFRNIHRVPPGTSKSVGGNRSTFLIYYVPMPGKIGDIHNDGNQYIFIPKRKKFFPDLTEPLTDCLNKEIRAFSKLGQLVTFKFQEYISPLEEINNLMLYFKHSEHEKRKLNT